MPWNFRLFDTLARLQKSNWRTISVTYCSYSELVISVVLRRCDLYQKLPRPYDFPVADQNRFDDSGRRRAHRVFHLHRLEDDQRIARRDLLPRLDQNLQHLTRHRRIGRSLLRCGVAHRMPGWPFDHARPEGGMDIQLIASLGDPERPLDAVNLDSNNAGG